MRKDIGSKLLILFSIISVQINNNEAEAADIAQVAFTTVIRAMKTLQLNDFSEKEITMESFTKDVFNRVVLREEDRGKLEIFTHTVTSACDKIILENALDPKAIKEAEDLKHIILTRHSFAEMVLRYKGLFNNALDQWKNEFDIYQNQTKSFNLPIGQQGGQLEEFRQSFEAMELNITRSFYKHYRYQHNGNTLMRMFSSAKTKGERYLKYGEVIHDDPFLGVQKVSSELFGYADEDDLFKCKTYNLYLVYLYTFSLLQMPEEFYTVTNQEGIYEERAAYFEDIFKIDIDLSLIKKSPSSGTNESPIKTRINSYKGESPQNSPVPTRESSVSLLGRSTSGYEQEVMIVESSHPGSTSAIPIRNPDARRQEIDCLPPSPIKTRRSQPEDYPENAVFSMSPINDSYFSKHKNGVSEKGETGSDY